MNYSEVESKVREATNDDAWGPSGQLMADISRWALCFSLPFLWFSVFLDVRLCALSPFSLGYPPALSPKLCLSPKTILYFLVIEAFSQGDLWLIEMHGIEEHLVIVH